MVLKENMSKNQTFTSMLNCQSCTNPLKLNFSFKEIDEEVLDELSHSKYLNADQDDRNILLQIYHKHESSAMRKVMVPANICDVAGDFMVVGELASLPLDSTQSLKITDSLLRFTSDQSTIDRPLCETCTDNILDQMDSQLKMSEDEVKLYDEVLTTFKSNNKDGDDIKKLQAKLKQLKKEETVLEAQLQELETKKRSTKEKLKSYVEEAETLEKEEKKHWNEYCKIKHQILLAEDSEQSVNNQLIYAKAQLNQLTNSNVFNTTFHIWHSDNFGIINNFRLGRLPKEPVEWLEINAAWGQAVLLLHSLAQKINLTFKRYRLVLYGNQSYIVPLDNKTRYFPLYCLGGIKYVLDNRFDDAMVAFLDCLQQFKEKVEKCDSSFCLPYKMDKGKIEDKRACKSYSIKIYLNSQEHWTKALKLMLTNLEWALAWVSTQFQDK